MAKKTERDLAVALRFANLEILEVMAGKRALTQCPGVENVMKHITEAKRKLNGETERQRTRKVQA